MLTDPKPASRFLRRSGCEPVDLEVEILGDAAEQPIADPAADDQRPAAGGVDGAGDRPRRVERIGRRRTSAAAGSLTAPLPWRSACGRSAGRCDRPGAGNAALTIDSSFDARVRVDLGLSALDAAHDGARDVLGRLARARALHLEALLARHRVAELGLGADREHDADAHGRARELDAQALRQPDLRELRRGVGAAPAEAAAADNRRHDDQAGARGAQQVGERGPRQQERPHVVQVEEARHRVRRRVERASRGSRRRRWRLRYRGCRRCARVSSIARATSSSAVTSPTTTWTRPPADRRRSATASSRSPPPRQQRHRAALRGQRHGRRRPDPRRRAAHQRDPPLPLRHRPNSLPSRSACASRTRRRLAPAGAIGQGIPVMRSRVHVFLAAAGVLVSVLSLVAAQQPPAQPAGPIGGPSAPEPRLRNIKQLTFGGENAEAYFSPDGKQLIFQSTRDGGGCDQQYVMNVDGTRRAPRVVRRGAHDLRLLHAGWEAHRLRQHARRRRRVPAEAVLRARLRLARSTTATTSTWRTPTAAA